MKKYTSFNLYSSEFYEKTESLASFAMKLAIGYSVNFFI
jgi:hypothetical protein